jgi:hypothetical protein
MLRATAGWKKFMCMVALMQGLCQIRRRAHCKIARFQGCHARFLAANDGFESVGFEKRRQQIRRSGAYFACFLGNISILPLQPSQNLPSGGRIFAAMFQI